MQLRSCITGRCPRRPRSSRLENSRAFPEAPIGGGPIVRGRSPDHLQPALTDDIARIAEDIAGGLVPTASQKQSDLPRVEVAALMAGGVRGDRLLPRRARRDLRLPAAGNYHNMANLDEARAGTLKDRSPAASTSPSPTRLAWSICSPPAAHDSPRRRPPRPASVWTTSGKTASPSSTKADDHSSSSFFGLGLSITRSSPGPC